MKSYLDLAQHIIDNGSVKPPARTNMPETLGVHHAVIQMNMADGFPLLTSKKVFWKGMVHELLWFLRGETNIKYLVDNKVNIWNDDAYRWYKTFCENKLNGIDYDYVNPDSEFSSLRIFTKEEFIENIKSGKLGERTDYKLGDLGKVYGYNWRKKEKDGKIYDQVEHVLNGLKNKPFSRYHILDGWDITNYDDAALMPCHLLYNFMVRPLTFKERRDLAYNYAIENNKIPLLIDTHGNKGIPKYMTTIDNTGWNIPKYALDLSMYQRSADFALGVPLNLASMSLLLMLFAKTCNMKPGVATWIGGDVHLYENHIDTIKEQIKREPLPLPTINIKKDITTLDDILNLNIDDFELINYQSHPKINFELFVGL
jgi:thymidylate synthase